MKVYLSNYRNHWISPYIILKVVCFWEKDEDRIYNLKDNPNNPYKRWVNFLDPICVTIQKVLDFVHPRINYVKLDRWDTWSMDHTLADIILPMLKQLHETKHGAPFVDDKDVPEELKSTSSTPKENEWDTDDNHFKRWDYILNEMIWAFEQKVQDDAEQQFFEHTEQDASPWDKNYVRPKYDKEGHQAWQERKANGYKMFGKYYENLWD